MERRDFLTWIGVGTLATSLPVAIAACSKKGSEWETIGKIEDLEKDNQLLTESSTGPILIVATPPKQMIAVNPTCTHANCTVGWKSQAKKFTCPCHGSEFGIDGQVMKGPATRPLNSYQTKTEGNSILVKLV